MRVSVAKELANEIWESTAEDIITTCEGVPEDIGKVLKEVRKLAEKMAKDYE